MARYADVPQFGPLSGVRVVHASISFAGPFTAEIMAEMGADVIWIESIMGPDTARVTGMPAEQDRRNQRTICLNIPSPQGRQIFLDLLKDADIFIEASKGGQYARWGLSDEVLWSVNPKLVIIHISGFGQVGVAEDVARASFDGIAQAYGCLLGQNGFADRAPTPAMPVVADYMTTGYCIFAALAGLYKARRSGKGESVDMAQYEAVLRGQATVMDYLNGSGRLPQRKGNRHPELGGFGSYVCQDEKVIYVELTGREVLQKALPLLGLEYGSALFPEGCENAPFASGAGQVLDAALQAFCAQYPAMEADARLASTGAAASLVVDFPIGVEHPHYRDRQVWNAVPNTKGQVNRGIRPAPLFKRYPCQVWRGLPDIGYDTADILLDLGYDEQAIAQLVADKIVKFN